MLRSLARRYSSSRAASSPHSQPFYTAHVRLWDQLSMRDVFYILNAIELKYGRIREFKCRRDYEIQTRYQRVMFVTFFDPGSIKSLSREGDVLRISVPPLLEEAPGGIGLHQALASLEQDVTSEPNKLESEENRIVTCRITAGHRDLFTPAQERHPPILPALKHEIGREFLSWAGFQPLENLTSHKEGEALSPLRIALRNLSQLTGRPEPGVVPEHTESAPESQVSHDRSKTSEDPLSQEWEPLPSFLPLPRRQPLTKDIDLSEDPILRIASALSTTLELSSADAQSLQSPLLQKAKAPANPQEVSDTTSHQLSIKARRLIPAVADDGKIHG